MGRGWFRSDATRVAPANRAVSTCGAPSTIRSPDPAPLLSQGGTKPSSVTFPYGQHPLPRPAQAPPAALDPAFCAARLGRTTPDLEPDEPCAGGCAVAFFLLAARPGSERHASAASSCGRSALASGCYSCGWLGAGRFRLKRAGGSARPGRERADFGLR